MISQFQVNNEGIIDAIKKFINQDYESYIDITNAYEIFIQDLKCNVSLPEGLEGKPICSKSSQSDKPFSLLPRFGACRVTIHVRYYKDNIATILIATKALFLVLMQNTPNFVREKFDTMQEVALSIVFLLAENEGTKKKIWDMWTELRTQKSYTNHVLKIRKFLRFMYRTRKENVIRNILNLSGISPQNFKDYPYSAILFPRLKEAHYKVMHIETNVEAKQGEKANLLGISQSRYSQLYNELMYQQVIVPFVEIRLERIGFKRYFIYIILEKDREKEILQSFSYIDELIAIQISPEKKIYIIIFYKPANTKYPKFPDHSEVIDWGEIIPGNSFQYDAVGLHNIKDKRFKEKFTLKNHFEPMNEPIDLSQEDKKVLAQVIRNRTVDIDKIQKVCRKQRKHVVDALKKFRKLKIAYKRNRTIQFPNYQYQVLFVGIDEVKFKSLENLLRGEIPFIEGHFLQRKEKYAIIKLGGSARDLTKGKRLIETEIIGETVSLHTFEKITLPNPRISFDKSWIFRYDTFKFLKSN